MARLQQFWGISLAILFLIVFFFVLLASDWSGTADRCYKKATTAEQCDTAEVCDSVDGAGCMDCCYCEATGDGQIKQPQNTWFIFPGSPGKF